MFEKPRILLVCHNATRPQFQPRRPLCLEGWMYMFSCANGLQFPFYEVFAILMSLILFATLVAIVFSITMVVTLTLSNYTVTPPSFSFPFSSSTFRASTMPLLTYKLWNFAIITNFANLIFCSSSLVDIVVTFVFSRQHWIFCSYLCYPIVHFFQVIF